MRALERVLYVLSAVAIVAGAATVVLGSDSVPSPGETTANLESELRFYAVWWIGAGVFLLWLARRVATATTELRAFCALLFLAGLARLVSVVDDGWPSAGQNVLMALELALPVVLVVWQSRAARARTDPPRRG